VWEEAGKYGFNYQGTLGFSLANVDRTLKKRTVQNPDTGIFWFSPDLELAGFRLVGNQYQNYPMLRLVLERVLSLYLGVAGKLRYYT